MALNFQIMEILYIYPLLQVVLSADSSAAGLLNLYIFHQDQVYGYVEYLPGILLALKKLQHIDYCVLSIMKNTVINN